jgi:hypothetical protein
MTKYRPISLLSTFSKVLRKVMYKTFCRYMHTDNFIVPDTLALGKVCALKMQHSG